MTEFPSNHKFKESEKKWQALWQKKNIYRYNKEETRENTYVVDTPPPGVSGQLHIGHIFSYTHTDLIVRYKRMKGMNIFYPMGFDDNGLPTERLVEKTKKIRANTLPRNEFIAICHDVIAVEEQKFKDLFNWVGLSVDWSLEYQTISPTSCKISQMSFLDLAQKGQIYRNSQPMLWDPADQTALAQAEIEDQERMTFMNDILFSLEDGTKLKIATTRPELLPACVAVFFHPDDKRYAHLAGLNAITPLFGVKVPILADDLVDPEKGTGLVMCCTFGDQTDVLWWRKHKLPTKIIITKYGTIDDISFSSENTSNIEIANGHVANIIGLKIAAARSKIIEMLQQEGSLVSQTEKQQSVKCAERSGAPLEILTTPQWFIKTVEHKAALLEKSNELVWHPKTMKIKLDQWISGVNLDWCISRQRYFGVPFPVWYSKRAGEEGKILFAEIDQLPVDPMRDLPKGYSREEVDPDTDVMDTWSTSSVSPQLNSFGIGPGFMIDEVKHKAIFPADLRPQAHEIIRTWAFYTLLKAHLHENTVPWKNIMISGWCLAEDRSKMSKSKGNVVVPEKLLEEFGADVVRYWAASAKLGADTAFSSDVMKQGKRLVNKIWNAAKFVSQHFDKLTIQDKNLTLQEASGRVSSDFDKYLLFKLSELISASSLNFEKYEYSSVIDLIEEFFWNIFCDNYLEITKSRAYDEHGNDQDGAYSARLTLYHCFKTILTLFAPFMPYVTEELYQLLYIEDHKILSIHGQNNWPQEFMPKITEAEKEQSENLLVILELVRKGKAQDNLSIKAAIKYLEISGANLSDKLLSDLKNVISAEEIKFLGQISSDVQNLQSSNLAINMVYA